MEPNARPDKAARTTDRMTAPTIAGTTFRLTARTRVRWPAPGVKLVKNVMLPMPDGVRLAADVYLPDDGRDELSVAVPMAVVMDYIPYRKDEVNPAAARLYLELPRRGYAAIRVDIRGTGASEGINTDEYTLQEQTDGAAAVEWIAAQPWCDGHVNVMGISYGGFTALQIAALAPEHLTSVIPVDFTDDRYTDDCHYRGGLLRMYYDVGWYGTRMIAWGAMPPDPDWSVGDWASVWEQHIADNEPYLLKWLTHQADGEYWRNGSVGDGSSIRCPVFLIGGWRDGYPNPPLRLFANLRVPKKVLVGPWNHAYPDGAILGSADRPPRRGRTLARSLVQGRRERRHGRAGGRRLHAGVRSAGCRPARSGWRMASRDGLGRRQGHPNELLPARRGRAAMADAALAGERADGRERSGATGERVAAVDEVTYHPTVGLAAGLWSGGIQFGLPGDQRPDEALSLDIYIRASDRGARDPGLAVRSTGRCAGRVRAGVRGRPV